MDEKIDKIHIPHIGFHHWIPQSDQKCIKSSEEDKVVRPIYVRFFLEDIRARTPYVYASLPEIKEFHAKYGEHCVDFWFEENKEKNLLQSIFVGMQVGSVEKAFTIANTHILSMLSMMSYRYRRPFGIRSICISDGNHKAKWVIHPSCPGAIKIKIPQPSFLQSEPIGSMFSLYREGMNNNSDSYRFLCFFKIVEAWQKRKCAFKSTDDAYLKLYGSEIKRSLIVTKILLSGAYHSQYHDEFINRKFSIIFNKLSEIRNLIAHPFKDKTVDSCELFMNLDSPQNQAYIGAISNLVERMATKILDEEVQILIKIDPSLHILE